jgi:hypothetical protein
MWKEEDSTHRLAGIETTNWASCYKWRGQILLNGSGIR